MKFNHLDAELQAKDRWASRRQRLVEFLREHGLSGLLAKMREVGLRGTIAFIVRQGRYQICSLLGKRWDRKYGVDTSGQIDLDNVDVIGPNKASGYASVSTSPRAFAYLSQFFPANWKDFTFVDIGCGKGRVVMLAAQFGFDRVQGIEFAPLLCRVADQNLVRFSGRRPAEWAIINVDATTVDLPSGNPLLIYCFNPFTVDIWERFIPALVRANELNRRPMRLVISGSLPETIRAAAAVILRSQRFCERAHGVTPFFMDAYAPYTYWIFDSIEATAAEIKP
ncbi:hypothetical protein BRAS3843_3160051 [Bradyrhizobium sp. STM 3843]|uniref:hypothetical protein n=1 Tax=Bradyrhizobium sp. STM 3843 TaxID=551947 RepID=UPI0002404FD0|nr:hypothetical protein [Bradyrhizobium sp. STM 3843]CCE09363.1 hypothetical protein BRAS3843_3160051 [Bradyrhizobium sp. STM 3843]